ncbi:Zn-dependent protease [Lentzea sp. NBRC 105346]|uniref:M48 family metallopeptidase n=1 Tax=Lentzea sp. NBRC 105346 TaxID=3032205 RepID=UPI0024A1AA60|nr:M48 family metallopeptidase [Lentzea sp. NBRC 105346]GLZ31059.1 Zn-dependent protease [Lentzea sp. NBRC 105346]
MLVSLRAAVAVAMLAGFYVLALGLVGGLVALEVYAFNHSVALGAKLAFLIVALGYALVRALITVEKLQEEEDVSGVRVTVSDQPELWGLVRMLADKTGTRAPDSLTIVADVNAGVSERTRLLGLRVVRREMFIGAPLLACLTEAQLTAVLAHELGHYGRPSGVVMTGRNALLRVVSGFRADDWFQKLLARLFKLYAKLYFRVSGAICRRQEFAADVTSARIAGSDAAASALREVPVIGAAWTLFVERHLTAAWAAGYLPDTFFDGFASLLAAPELRVELDEIRRNPVQTGRMPYDSHPPLPDRIEAIHALASPGKPGGDRPATALLHGDVLDQSLLDSMVAEAGQKTRVDWVTLGHIGARGAAVRETASLLRKAGGTLGHVLDALDAGRIAELGPSDARPGAADAGPRARREFARPYVCNDVTGLVALALSDAGLASWHLSWTGNAQLVTQLSIEDAITLAMDGDTAELRAQLAAAGVGLDYHPVQEG